MRKRLQFLAAAAIALPSMGIHAQSSGIVHDSALVRLVRQVVVDSLVEPPAREKQTYTVGDAVTSTLLEAIGIDARHDTTTTPACPNSTSAAGERVASPYGYRLRVRMTPTADSTGWLLDVSKTCRTIINGVATSRSIFGQGARWEIRQRAGEWRIVKTLQHWMT